MQLSNDYLFRFLTIFFLLYNEACTIKNSIAAPNPIESEENALDSGTKNSENGYHIIIRPIFDYLLPNDNTGNEGVTRYERFANNEDGRRIVKVALTSYIGPKRKRRKVKKSECSEGTSKRKCETHTPAITSNLHPKLKEVDITLNNPNHIGKVPLEDDNEATADASEEKVNKRMSNEEYEEVENLGNESENFKELSKSKVKKMASIDMDVVNKKRKKVQAREENSIRKQHRKRRQCHFKLE